MCKDKPYVDLYFATDKYQKVVVAKGIYLNLPFKGCNQAERTDHVTDVHQKYYNHYHLWQWKLTLMYRNASGPLDSFPCPS